MAGSARCKELHKQGKVLRFPSGTHPPLPLRLDSRKEKLIAMSRRHLPKERFLQGLKPVHARCYVGAEAPTS
jgi:hypothetical protein